MERRSIYALVVILTVTFAAAAQQPGLKSSADAEATRAAAEKRAELERKAVALLREAVEESQSLKLVENRVRAQTTAAALLWARDEAAARALFKAAAEALAAYGSSLESEDAQFYGAAQSFMQLRSDLIQSLSQFDAKLALEYLRSTRTAPAEAMRAAGFPPDSYEQQLEMALAARVASQDPAQALRMAEESLRRGLSPSLVQVLTELRAKDPAGASKLASEIVKRLRAEDLLKNYESGALATQLLSLAKPDAPPSPPGPASGPADGWSGGPAVLAPEGRPAPGPLLDGRTRSELVEKILAAAASSAPNDSGSYNVFNALQMILPEVEKADPSRAESLRRRAAALERGFNPQADAWREFREVSEKGTVDAILEAAPKAPPEMRDQLYTQAVWKALGEGDADRARRLVDNIANPQQRGQTRKSIETQLQWRAAQQGDFAAARAAAARLADADERITALTQVAATALAKGDAREAKLALSEAGAVASSRQTASPKQFHALLQLAGVYAQLDAGAGFELVESSVARLNELLDAAAELEGFGQEAFREGELRPQQYGYVWNDLITRSANTLAALAPADFDRALAVAKSFRRPDARAAAELQLAQALLSTLRRGGEPDFQGRRIMSLSLVPGRID